LNTTPTEPYTLRTGLPQTGHSLAGASVNDCTSSNSCFSSGLVQTYWYVGTAATPRCADERRGLALSPGDCQ
jgi:hypothetical protein